jgi:hypothetical protein
MKKKTSEPATVTTDTAAPAAPSTDDLSDLLVSDQPKGEDDLSGIGKEQNPAEGFDQVPVMIDGETVIVPPITLPSTSDAEVEKRAADTPTPAEDPRPPVEPTGDEDVHFDDEDPSELPFDAIVLRQGTVLQFNGADVTLPFDVPVILSGSHDEATLAAILVRDRSNFELNRRLLTGEYNPMTGARVLAPRE